MPPKIKAAITNILIWFAGAFFGGIVMIIGLGVYGAIFSEYKPEEMDKLSFWAGWISCVCVYCGINAFENVVKAWREARMKERKKNERSR